MTIDADLATLRRALIAARDFLNRLPLGDGASKRAIDREFIGMKLIPEGLMAADRVEAEVARLRQEEQWWKSVNAELLPYQERAVAAERELARLREGRHEH